MQCLWQRELTPCRQAQGGCPLPLRQDAGLGPFMTEPSDRKKRVEARPGLPGANHTELYRQGGVASVGTVQRGRALGEGSGAHLRLSF